MQLLLKLFDTRLTDYRSGLLRGEIQVEANLSFCSLRIRSRSLKVAIPRFALIMELC